MRARWLKPEFFRDRKIATLSPIAALVYQALWVIADDGGMAPADPELLKGELFVYWSAVGVPEITGALQELYALHRVEFYQGSDELFAHVLNFERHQKVHKPSKFRNSMQYNNFDKVVPEWCGTGEALPQHSPPPRHLDTQTPKSSSSKKGRGQAAPWMGRVIETWQLIYPGSQPHPGTATALRPLFGRMGEDAAIEELTKYLSSTPSTYLNFGKFAATAGLGPSPATNGHAPRLNMADRVSETIAKIVSGEIVA